MSKSTDDATPVKPGSVIVGTTDVEPQEAVKDFDIAKASSTAEIIMGAPETTSPKFSQELPTKEETQTKEKSDSQITEATIVEETKIIPKRRKSREDPVSQKPSSITSVVAIKSESQRVSQELPPKEEPQTMEKSDSQITEATIVEVTKIIPKRRKSKEDPVSLKPSTRDVVTAPTEITVLEKGKMSPTRRSSKSPKPLSGDSTKEEAKITKEPDIQKSLAQTKAPHLQETILSATTVLPKTYAEIVMGTLETTSQTVSQELSPKFSPNETELEPKTVTTEKESRIESIVQRETVKQSKDVTTTDVHPDHSTDKMIRFEIEVSSTESPEGETLPEVKQEIPKILKTTSLKGVKDPGVQEKKVQVLKQEMQKTPKSQETEPVNKGEIIVTEREPKTVTKEKDSSIWFETVTESKDVTTTVKTIRFEVEVSSTESPEGETLPEVKQEIPKILKTTEESLKEVKGPRAEERKAQMLKQAMQETPKSQETEFVNKGEINVTESEHKTVTTEKESRIESIVQSETVESKDVTTTVKEIRFEVEVSSTESPECETLPEGKQEIPKILKTTEERFKEVKDPGAEEKKAQLLKQEIQEAPKSHETESVNKGKIYMSEREPKTVSKEKETSIWFETFEGIKDVTTTAVQYDPSPVKMIRFGVITERQQDAAQSDSTKLASAASTAMQPLEEKTESITLSFPEEDRVKPGQIDTQSEILTTTQQSLKEVKESKDVTTTDVQPDQPTVKTIRFEVEVSSTESPEGEPLPEVKQEIPKSLKTTSLKEVTYPCVQEKKVQVLKQEIQESPKSQETEPVDKGEINVTGREHKTVTKEKESSIWFETVTESKDVTTTVKTIRFEVEVSSTESPEGETLPEGKYETSADIHSEKAAVKTRVDVQELITERQQDAAQSDSTQPSSAASTAVQPLEEKTEPVEISSSKQDKVKPHRTSTLEHEAKIVHIETVKDHKDVTTTDVQSDQSLVKTIRFEVEVSSTESPECQQLEEVKQEIPKILKTTSLKEVKHPGVQEKKAQELKREMQESPKSQEKESVNKGEINVTEHEPKTVTTEKESSIWFETVTESKDVTTTVKTIRFEVEVSSTESPEGETLPEVKQEIPKILKTTEERLKEVKDPAAEEKKVQLLKQEMQESPKSQKTESVNKGEINVTEREPKTVSTEKESSIKDVITTAVQYDPSPVKMIRFGVITERQQDAAQSDSTKLASAASTAMQPLEEKTESITLSFPEEDRVKPGQIDTQSEILAVTQQSLKEVKESKDVTTTDVQPDPSTVKTIRFEVEVSSTESPSGLSVDPRVQTHKHRTDPTEKKEEEQEEKRLIQKQQSETIVKAEKQNVPLPKSTVATTGEVWHHVLGLPKEQLRSVEKISPAQKSATHVILEEVAREEGFAAWENKEEERVLKKQGVELAESSGHRRIFPEIQLLAGTGPGSEITEVKSHDDTPETLITSTTDMDERVDRLVSKILSCKNRPAELSPAAMARQVEEVEQCRESAQAQGSLLSQPRGAESEDSASLDHLEDQWSAAAQDAAGVIQSKEAQLELVVDYGRQTQTAQTRVEGWTAELDSVETSKEQSSSKEAEHLCSFQRSMEDNRTVLGELLVTFTKLYPHLSQSERSNALTEQRNLHERWRGLERAVERRLHHTRVHSHQTSSLQSAISNLREHLETIDKDIEAKSPAVTQWNCKKAQQLMEANAEVKAAKQKFLYLQKLSDALMLSSRWEKETKEIQQGLQMIQDKLSHTEELVSSQTQSSSNPIMEKIITVMRDGLAWAKQTESDIEGRRKTVALLPEEVHRQLRDLKKLQSEVLSKQGQLESLVEEVTELLPQLDQAEEVPVVRTSLQTLQKLSHSTTDKLANAVREIESGLQTREKMSEQIADLDSWVVAHLHREASRSEDSELRSPTELDRRVRQLQETLAEADKQSAVCEALLMKSKDISSELSISDKRRVFEKLTNLQDDIRAISSYEKVNKKELEEVVQTRESNKKNLVNIEQSLRQMLGDLSRHRFPITRESLQPVEPFKHMILEHKSQVDLLQPWIPQEKTKELYSIISEIHSKLINLETKGRDHEKYLSMRQRMEDLRDDVPVKIRQTKDDSKQLEDKYRICQNLIVQIPLIQWLCEEARSELQVISTDLYPSQLSAEQQRLKQSDETLDTLQITLYNNLSIIEWNLLKELDLESVKKDTEAFLSKNQQELGKVTALEPNETAIDKEYQTILSLKKTVESRIRALEMLEQKKGKRRGSKSHDWTVLKKSVLSECDSKMENLLQARESWRSYTRAVKRAVQFLRDIELCLLPPCGSTGPCSDRVEGTQKALVSLQQQFQTHVEQLQSQSRLHRYLSPQKTEQLQENILSQLLVRMSTLQAKGHVQLESLSRCAEHLRSFNKSRDEIFQRVKGAESSLLQFISQKPTCLPDCTDQEAKLRALSEEVESLLRRLEELNERCPEQSCGGGQGAAVTGVWKTVSRLRRCTRELAPRSKLRIAEWRDVTNSVEKASTVLELVEAELPDASQAKASTEELHDVLQSWEQYQDRLDCEHRSLSALELRAARMLGVPAHLEQAPPTPLCQQLQAMQARYSSVKQRSKEGLEASRLELQEREKVWKDLQGVRVWLEAADGLLSEMEKSSSTQQLQEVHGQLFTQKALLLRIMESMKTKYSDMNSPVPVEIEGQLQEIIQSLQQVEVKAGEAVERSGPVHRLGAKLSEIQAGLRSVQKRLEQRSPTVIEAKVTQKRVWDELDVWHSCLAALEVDMQDLDKPEEALSLTERMVEVQQRHSQLAKQAEQRTTLLSKTQAWLQEHREMISSSKSWMSEAQSWLAAPCTYTSAKCLSSHVHSLQMVLGDSAQIRTTLQGFRSVLQEMSQICDVKNLHQQLLEADRQVADVQDSFTAPLSQLEHAAAEVEAIESEVKRMENEVAEIKTLLSSPETVPSPREESLKEAEMKIQSMRATVAEIQRCKPGLCLPEQSDETLTVFTVVDQLQNLLLDLEKKVPALFIQQPPTPVQAKAPSADHTTTRPQLLKSPSEEAEKEDAEEGQITIVHVEENVLTRLGATLQTVERSPPEQRLRPQEPEVVESEETEAASGQSTEQTGEETQDVQETSDPTEASSSEALSRAQGSGSTQSLPESMVNTPSTANVSKDAPGPQQRCVLS